MTLPAAVRPAGRTQSGLIRVASVPAGHVYVRHIADPSGGDGPKRCQRKQLEEKLGPARRGSLHKGLI